MKGKSILCKAVCIYLGLLLIVWAGEGHGRKNKASHDEELQNKKAEKAAKKAEIQEKVQAKKEEAKEKKEQLQEKIQERIDQRQENQEKRIQHGIKKGYLTEDEIKKLQGQQQTIATLETQAFADGKLTKDEGKEIRNAVQDASRCIWAEKHDTEGEQMPTYRLGKNVFAKDSLTSQLANEDLSEEQAKALLKDFRTLVELKNKLATADLSDAERTALQEQYDNLLNQYFEIK